MKNALQKKSLGTKEKTKHYTLHQYLNKLCWFGKSVQILQPIFGGHKSNKKVKKKKRKKKKVKLIMLLDDKTYFFPLQEAKSCILGRLVA